MMASQTSEKDVESSAQKALPKFRSSDLPSRRLLGKGLRSIVYETMLDGKRYARKDFVEVPKEIFQDEASVLIGLGNHKNIVKTYGLTVDDRSCSLVLKYMDDDFVSFLQRRKESKRNQASKDSESLPGQSHLIHSSLDKFMKERRKSTSGIPDTSPLVPPLEFQEALDFMLQIARGIKYLHEQNIAHGDLKPRNVLVRYSNDGENSVKVVKVADFGLVQTKSKSMSFVSPEARKLDMAQWKAPEYLDSVFGHKFDEKSLESDSDGDEDMASRSGNGDWLCKADVYSFALTCFQILTGEVPYSNLKWKELVDEIVSQRLRPELPDAMLLSKIRLNFLLKSCWDSDPAERPTFSNICDTLLEIIQFGEVLPPKLNQGIDDSIDLEEANTKDVAGRHLQIFSTIPKTAGTPRIIEGGSMQKPPVIPTVKDPNSTTPPHLITAKSAAKHPLNVPLVPKHSWDIEYAMGSSVSHGVHLGLTESDIERHEGISINEEDDDDALQPYYEIKRLLWIKRNTVYSLSLDEWDRQAKILSDRVHKKKKRSGDLKNKTYQLVGIFLLLQGVLFTAVAQLAQSSNEYENCKKVWTPVILTVLVWAVAIVGVWQKLRDIQEIDDGRRIEEFRLREYVRRVTHLRIFGQRFKFRNLKKTTMASPSRHGCHFWITRFGVIVVTLSIFTGIFIASHFLILCNRGMAPIKASSLAS